MTIATSPWQIGRMGAPPPPMVSGFPLLGIAPRLGRDPLAFFVRLYKKHGPVFQIKIFNRNITVLAGLDANHLLRKDGDRFLSSELLFEGFGRELHTDHFLTAMDGPAHHHFRKQCRHGYSRSAIKPHLPDLIERIDTFTRALKPGERLRVLPVLQGLVTEQLGIVIAGRTPNQYFRALQFFLKVNLYVNVLRLWPAFLLKTPPYLRAKQAVLELGEQVLRAHRESQTPADPDLIDDLLQAKNLKGDRYDENTLLAATVGPYFAGIDTVAASLSFLIYNILKHPETHQAIRAEARFLFRKSSFSMQELKGMEMLHATVKENLRMYPVAPFTPRVTTSPFTFHGYQVPANTEVFFAQTVTHFQPEFFPEPEKFIPQRFMKGAKKMTPGAFAPYTLGAHLCLGAGLAEAQMMLTAARLVHNLDLSLDPINYRVSMQAAPLPNPGTRFRIEVIENHTA